MSDEPPINRNDLDIAYGNDVIQSILCADCEKGINDCECVCEECDGVGTIETFEDKWSHSRSCHYTVDVIEECPSCEGDGKKKHCD